MQYHDGSTVALGDIVNVPVPAGTARARVIMLGESYEHLDIDPTFLTWVKRDRVLQPSTIVVEWIEGNPYAHSPHFSRIIWPLIAFVPTVSY